MGLIPSVFKIPIIYSRPKIHKANKQSSGQPIINGIESLTVRLGEYIDHVLQPLVQNTQAYLKNTKHIIQLIQKTETWALNGH